MALKPLIWHTEYLMGTRNSDFSGFHQILGSMRLPKAIKSHLKNHELWSRWQEIVGLELSRVTSPKEIKGKTLIVSVVHQAWAHQLHFLTPSILTKMRALCPGVEVKDLHYVVGEVVSQEWESPREEIVFQEAQLSERQEMTLRAVEDDKLRASIRRAMEAASRRRIVKA